MHHTDTAPDNDTLMMRIGAGDEAALALLYERFRRAVYNQAFRILHSPDLAEEVTQDVFLAVWRRAEHYDAARGRLSTWILTIARYTAIDRLRQSQRCLMDHTLELNDVLIELKLSRPTNPAERGCDRLAMLTQLIEQLPPEQRQVSEASLLHGLSHAQIAARDGLPLGTVKTRLRSAMRTLRERWQTYEGTPERASTTRAAVPAS